MSARQEYNFRNLKPLWLLLREWVVVLTLSLVSTSALAAPFYVPSGSMEPTLAIGDGILATKFDYGYSRYSLPFSIGPASDRRLLESLPARGDVVVFHLPRDPSVVYVKRVIGLPGDRIQMRDGLLFINGRAAELHYEGIGRVEMEDGTFVPAARFRETLPGGVSHKIYRLGWDTRLNHTAEFKVPPGHLFMMGDNRDNSLDSRVPAAEGGVGFVPMENLVGRARLVVGSYDYVNAGPVWAWLAALRPSRFFSRGGLIPPIGLQIPRRTCGCALRQKMRPAAVRIVT